MKKIRIILTGIFLATLTLSSCEKYLDVKKNSSKSYIESVADCQVVLDHYTNMNTGYPSDGLASSDDYYLGTNTFPGNLGQDNKDVYTWQMTAMRGNSDPQWIRPYNIVYFANYVLESLDKLQGTADATVLNGLKGAALFFRSYAFWCIAQQYTKPYGPTANIDLGIPLRTSSDINDTFGRGTVKETYDRIIQDLKEAVNLLPATSIVATRPNKASANAMLARVYLSMEDYTNAFSSADASLQLKGNLLDYNAAEVNKTSATAFTRFNPEVLFHAVLTNSTISSTPILSAGSASNPIARINMDLYNSYDNNDLRKTVFFKRNNDGSYRFSGNYEPAVSAALFSGLTTAEMYLTRAECYARAGNAGAAMGDVNTLLQKRWNNTVTYIPMTATNADDALSKVLLERRKELVMRGQRWTDLRRLNKDTRFKVDLVRITGTDPNQVIYTLPANDPRYTLLLPNDIIQQGYPQNLR